MCGLGDRCNRRTTSHGTGGPGELQPREYSVRCQWRLCVKCLQSERSHSLPLCIAKFHPLQPEGYWICIRGTRLLTLWGRELPKYRRGNTAAHREDPKCREF